MPAAQGSNTYNLNAIRAWNWKQIWEKESDFGSQILDFYSKIFGFDLQYSIL